MKILKIFGLVVGIHLFALVLIFANPGCSSTTKPPPAPSDTILQASAPASVTYPEYSSAAVTTEPPIPFDPDAPAMASSTGASGGVRFTPTRPGSPAAVTLTPEPVTDVRPATTYTVVSGDNLWNLAKKYGVTVGEIAGVNNMSTSTVLRPGQKLIIPAKAAAGARSAGKAAAPKPAPATPEPPRPAAPADGVTHVIKPGETLGSIARRYGVKTGDIAVANNITDPQKIRAGMELVIPGWKTPGGAKAAKSAPRPAPDTAPTTVPPGSTDRRTDRQIDPVREPAPAEVPVIRVEDSPISPAPKS